MSSTPTCSRSSDLDDISPLIAFPHEGDAVCKAASPSSSRDGMRQPLRDALSGRHRFKSVRLLKQTTSGGCAGADRGRRDLAGPAGHSEPARAALSTRYVAELVLLVRKPSRATEVSGVAGSPAPRRMPVGGQISCARARRHDFRAVSKQNIACAQRPIFCGLSIRSPLSSPDAKIFYFRFFGNCVSLPPSRLIEEGRCASSRYAEAGSGGHAGCARRAQLTWTEKSCGPGAATLALSLQRR